MNSPKIKEDITVDTWERYLHPRLIEKKGRMLSVGKASRILPQYFYGKYGNSKDWNFASLPYLSLELHRKVAPKEIFQEQFLGKFIRGGNHDS